MTWTQNDPTPQLWWESMCGVQHDDTSLMDTAVLCAHFAQPSMVFLNYLNYG